MEHGTERLAGPVAEALSGHRCVSVWLGHGNVLFLGFGSEVVPPHGSEGRRTVPPYELQTGTAGWRVEGPISAGADDERLLAERAVAGLLGREVVAWGLDDGRSLWIKFAGGGVLQVIPPTEGDPDFDEWWFCSPDSRYIGIGGGGQVVTGRTD